MRLSRKMWMALMFAAFLLEVLPAGGANGGLNSEKRDYSVIVDRNPFGLRPPPPPRTNAATVAQPWDEILLTGITSIGDEQAYFMSKSSPGHPSEYYKLGVGEQENGLEVIDIDPAAKTVRVRHGEVETVMTFQANGVKPPPAASRVAPGRVPTGSTARSTVASRAQTSRIRTIPTRNVRTTSTPRPAPVNPNRSPVRPFAAEQDVIMLELQRISNPHIQFPPTPGLSP